MSTLQQEVINTTLINGWEVAAVTRHGFKHDFTDNQDVYGLGSRHIAVFDGVGGEEGGKAASRAAVAEFLKKEGRESEGRLFDSIAAAVGVGVSRFFGTPGTTGTIARLNKDGTAWVGGVGDSPAIQINGFRARQLLDLETTPNGELTNMLDGAYYSGLHKKTKVAAGGLLVLSTDGGLRGRSAVENQLIAERAYAQGGDEPSAFVRALFEHARSEGFKDDVTIVAARYLGQAAVGNRPEAAYRPLTYAQVTEKPTRGFGFGEHFRKYRAEYLAGLAVLTLATTFYAVKGRGAGQDTDVKSRTAPTTATTLRPTTTTLDPQIAGFFDGEGAAELTVNLKNVEVYGDLGGTESKGRHDVIEAFSVGEGKLLVTCPEVTSPQRVSELTADEVCWINRTGKRYQVDARVRTEDTIKPSITK